MKQTTFTLLLCIFLHTLKLHAQIGIINENGWTEITPDTDTRKVYVSSSLGDDTNDGLSQNTPKKSIKEAWDLIRNGYADQLLLKRGDTWTLTTGITCKSGRSADHPLLITYYGDNGNRPVIRNIYPVFNLNGNVLNNFAIIGIEFYGYTSDPKNEAFTNESCGNIFRWVGSGSNILVEDCNIRFNMIVVQGYEGRFSNFSMRRSIVVDAWSHNSWFSHDGRIQGIYVSGTDGVVFEECLFDHNGWSDHVQDAMPNMYNHNLYIQYGTSNCRFTGNIITWASAHGLQARSGGIIEKNLFVKNAIAVNSGYHAHEPTAGDWTTSIKQNVVLEGRLMDHETLNTDFPRNQAIWGIWISYVNGPCEDNIIANRWQNGVSSALPIDNGADIELKNNIIYQWESSKDMNNPDWLNPDRKMSDYHVSVDGEASLDAFIQKCRNRKLGEMFWEYTAYAPINYIREGFNKEPVNGLYQYKKLCEGGNVTGISLNKNELILNGSETKSLVSEIIPDNANDKTVSWLSSDKEIVNVDENGLITAVQAGEATISVTTNSGSHTAICNVTVNPIIISVTGISLRQNSVSMLAGETTQLNIRILPSDATDKSVTWESSDNAIASVNNNGLVTAIAQGKATITVTSNDGHYYDTCQITVNSQGTDIRNQYTANQSGIRIYPNPLHNQNLIIALPEPAQAEINIMNMNGGLIYHRLSNKQIIKIDSKILASGIYWIEIQTQKTIERKKLIVK